MTFDEYAEMIAKAAAQIRASGVAAPSPRNAEQLQAEGRIGPPIPPPPPTNAQMLDWLIEHGARVCQSAGFYWVRWYGMLDGVIQETTRRRSPMNALQDAMDGKYTTVMQKDALFMDVRLQDCRARLADLQERYEGVVGENERMSTALNSIATALSTR